MNWHNVTELTPQPSPTVTILTEEGRTISGQTWDNDTRTFMPSGLGVKDVVWWVLSTELSTREE